MSDPGTVPRSEAIQHPSSSALTFEIPEPTVVSGSRRGRKEGSKRVGLQREGASSTPSSSHRGVVSPAQLLFSPLDFLSEERKTTTPASFRHSSMNKVQLSNQGSQIVKSARPPKCLFLRFFHQASVIDYIVASKQKLTNQPATAIRYFSLLLTRVYVFLSMISQHTVLGESEGW